MQALQVIVRDQMVLSAGLVAYVLLWLDLFDRETEALFRDSETGYK